MQSVNLDSHPLTQTLVFIEFAIKKLSLVIIVSCPIYFTENGQEIQISVRGDRQTEQKQGNT